MCKRLCFLVRNVKRFCCAMAAEPLLSDDNTTHRTSTTAASATAAVPSGIALLASNALSLVTAVGINASVTVLCLCLVVTCLIFAVHRFFGRREERDKLCDIVTSRYWNNEDQIISVIQMMTKMREAIIFHDISAFHVLSYKYRCDNDVYNTNRSRPDDTGLAPSVSDSVDTFAVLKKIEHLFDALILELPYVRRCPRNVADTFGSTVFGLAQVTSLIWCDHKARLVRHLVNYFVGRDAAETFERALMSDRDLETMILSKVPYVGQLYLNVDHFVLKDVVILNEAKVELKAKIRYVDTILARNGKILASKEQAIIESYYAARDICLKNGFIQSKMYFPEMVTKFGGPPKIDECVVCLRHLVRLMCYGTNMKKMENDEGFYQFLMQLHEVLYTWVDAHAMLEVIERSRSNIISYLHGITVEQILMDREFTKAKLEHIEKELFQNLRYLAVPALEREPKTQPPSSAPLKAPTERLFPAESEISVYTMAPSTSSYVMKPPQTSPEHRVIISEAQERGMEQGSTISGSSLYVTAGSLSSASESTLPESKAVSLTPRRVEIVEASESEGECFETPV